MPNGKINNPAPPRIARPRVRRVLGIDPGSRKTGYAVIEKLGTKLTPLALGAIVPPPDAPFEKRLKIIFEELSNIIAEFAPEAVSMESLYAHKSALSAIKLGQARGVALLACALAELPIFDYAPAMIKKSMTGFGAAPKLQMQTMAQFVLGLKKLPPPDAADAAAIAICHLSHAPLK